MELALIRAAEVEGFTLRATCLASEALVWIGGLRIEGPTDERDETRGPWTEELRSNAGGERIGKGGSHRMAP